MAGKTIAGIGSLVGAEQKIVRAMPNTPAAIGQGITVAYAGRNVTAVERALAQTLLAATGTVEWVGAETLLDPVTAISGGGPAYLFLLTELMEQAGLAQGLPADLAKKLARQTIIGSAALLAASPEEPAALRRAVTSPAGTTEQALKILLADGAWPDVFARAIAAATERSAELSAS
jgi:pyrroline-5-carboxylate reductase